MGVAMTTDTRTGTVFDIGYQSYTGPREGRNRARLAVVKDGVRTALGLGRGAWPKVLPWLFICVLVLIAFIWALVIGAAERLGGPGSAAEIGIPSHSDYYGVASIIIFVFAAVGAPELLCPDRREGVISLYLVRPLTGVDYVFARWLAFFSVMVAVAWLPQFIMLVGLCMGDPRPVGYLRQHWLDIPRFLAAGIAISAYATTLAMLAAAFTTRRAHATVFLVGLFVITTPFTTGLASEIGGTAGQWISMFNLSNIPVHVNDVIFGRASSITRAAPAAELSHWILVGWYLVWTLAPAGVLLIRYRRLTP
jgi:ABC-2 type transport system permease protein